MYYLQSRYYNPEWGRFINADALVSTGQGILGNNMFAYCRNNPVVRKDRSGTADMQIADYSMEIDPDGEYDEAGAGSGGSVAGVSSSYYAMQNVRAYDSWWRNSGYNPNMTWSKGSVIQKFTNDATFNSFIKNPQSLKGKTASDMAKILGDTWKQGTYGSKGNGWKFNNGDKMIAYHPGGGRHSGSYYILSSSPTGRVKFIGPDYVASSNDGAIIFRID